MIKTKSPKVIFNSVYTLSNNNIDNKFGNHKKATKRIVKMYDYYTNEEKRAMSMYDYYTGKLTKEQTVNLVLENGEFATEKEVEKRKKQAVKYLEKSNLWQGVLSFNNDYLTQNIDVHVLEKELATNILPMFFRKCGFKDTKKMFYQLALHTDTDNLHFHFSFMEKEPNYIYSKNKIDYRRTGKLEQSSIDFLKAQIVHTIEKQKIYTPLLKETNKEIEELKKYFNYKEKNFLLYDKKDLLLEEKILTLGKMLDDSNNHFGNKIKYGSIKDKEIQQLTKEIKRELFASKNTQLKNEYGLFKKSLEKINNYFYKLYKDNNIKEIHVDNTLTKNKEKYIDNYVYNAIVNHALYNWKKQKKEFKNIKKNEIIQAIILKQYLKNKKNNSKKHILENYLSGYNAKAKFKNRYEIEQSIQNINQELEEASKKFSKLFNNYEL